MVLEAKPVISDHHAVGQKDITMSAVWWSRYGGDKGGLQTGLEAETDSTSLQNW